MWMLLYILVNQVENSNKQVHSLSSLTFRFLWRASLTNRIHIDAPTGIIEVEGEKEFVEAQLDKLMPLIQACGFGTRPKESAGPVPNIDNIDSRRNSGVVDGDEEAQQNSKKKSKRGVRNPPKGHSCSSRISSLRDEGFFKVQKSPSEIVEGLARKGWTHTSNQVSASAGSMFNRGDLQRTKSGNGFAYFWDRD
ncbi:MAG: hypothetical protein R3D34_10290 [Nitratireductor sp.]